MSRFLKLLLLGLLGVLLAPAWGAAADGVLKIGLMCPLTGKWASEGQDMQKVVGLLIDKVNKQGGINGQMLELEVADDAGDPRTAALAARKLTNSDVAAVIGTYGSAITEAGQKIIADADLVQIATGSTSIRLTEKDLPNFFRTCPRDDEQGMVAAKVIKEKNYKKVALLHDNSSYAKGLADETKALLDKEGVEVVFYDALTPGERDYTAILTKLRAAEPDLIFFTGYYNDAGSLLRQKAEMGWKVDMMGGDATNNADLVSIAGVEAANGYFFISPPLPQDLPGQAAKEFLVDYKAKYDNTLPSSIWSVLAGDAFKVLEEAFRAGHTQTEAISAFLKNDLKNYQGLSGVISFNEKGDRVGDLYRVYVVDPSGAFVIQP